VNNSEELTLDVARVSRQKHMRVMAVRGAVANTALLLEGQLPALQGYVNLLQAFGRPVKDLVTAGSVETQVLPRRVPPSD
jgi:hypothetical protein